MAIGFHKITAGNGYTYLTKQVAAADDNRGRQTLSDYYTEKGEQPGVWWGAGLASLPTFDGIHLRTLEGTRVSEDQMRALFGEGLHPDADLVQRALIAQGITPKQVMKEVSIGRKYAVYTTSNTRHQQVLPGAPTDAPEAPGPMQTLFVQRLTDAYRTWKDGHDRGDVPDDVRSEIRTRVAVQCFNDQYGRDPDERELGGFLAENSRPVRQACAGFDAVFSPVKSVSIMWALSDIDTSRHIQDIHDRCVRSTLEWLEANHVYTREGTNGVFHTSTTGLMATLFTHRTSRSGDPDLHTHCAIANRVYSRGTGKWLTIDGEGLYHALVAASEHYNLAMESLLHDELGYDFAPRYRSQDKQPIREIVGVSDDLITVFSKRRTAITRVESDLVDNFRALHGRMPTPIEARKLAQTATLQTRPEKVLSGSFAEQRSQWMAEAVTAMGPDSIRRQLGGFPSPGFASVSDYERLGREAFIELNAVEGLLAVTGSTACFHDTHLYAEASRRVKGTPLPEEDRLRLVEDLAQAMLAKATPLTRTDIAEVPDELTEDGHSVLIRPHSQLWTTREILDAEQRIITAGRRLDGATVRDVDLVIAESHLDGITLTTSQRAMVRQLSQSGRRLQLALAPAGTGKTTAMQVFADAWRASGGNVVGFSHQAIAAQELRRALGEDTPTGTLASLTSRLRDLPVDGQTEMVDDRTGEIVADPLAWWKKNITQNTMIIVDEAGMAGTVDLAALTRFALARGASITLIGDDRQLAAIGSGGILRDLRAEYGAATLNELMRFRDHTEGEATLAIRDGDHGALGWYADHGRIRSVTEPTSATTVFRDWVYDQQNNLDSIMLASTIDQVQSLNDLAQEWRRRTGQSDTASTVDLWDGSTAGAGDLVVTRLNDYSNHVTRTDMVKNRDRWIIQSVLADGSLNVVRADDPRLTTTLTPNYVSEHVELGYAETIHAAQGTTVDTCRVVINGTEDLAGLYVALSRGRLLNQAYVITGGSTDSDEAVFDEDARLRTAVDMLHDIMDRTDKVVSATTIQRENTDPFTQLFNDCSVYASAISRACRIMMTEQAVTDITGYADHAMRTRGYRPLSDEPAWETLLTEIMYRTIISGTDPHQLIDHIIDERPLDQRDGETSPARDYAAVLSWRLPPLDQDHDLQGPLSWLLPPPVINEDHAQRFAHASQWENFLRLYHDLIVEEATAISTEVRTWTRSTCPQWAVPLIDNHPGLVASIAIWRAANNVPENDLDPLGSRLPSLTVRMQRAHNGLSHQIDDALNVHAWDNIAPTDATQDPMWPLVSARLNDTITTNRATQSDLQQWITAESDKPLPVDHPATALWYRIVGHLTPVPADLPDHPTTLLTPPWTSQLLRHIPPDRHMDVLTDTSWPALVSLAHTIPPHDLDAYLDLAVQLTRATQVDTQGFVTVLTSELTDLLNRDHDVRVGADQTPAEPPLDSATAGDDAYLGTIWAEKLATTAPPNPVDIVITDEEITDEDQAFLDKIRAEQLTTGPAGTPAPDLPDEDDHLVTFPDDYGPTSRDRILELNKIAADYYHDAYPHSWASAYLTQRFGTSLNDDPRWQIGCAPAGWTSLIQHMRGLHITDQELLDAGLAKWRNGRNGPFLSDFFLDSVTLDVTDRNGQVLGFIARANPATHTDKTPKYQNSPNTRAYHKGDHLFGENLLTDDATPVLVEGPLDAVAVTLAAHGTAIGVAPSGTALTHAQAAILHPHLVHDPTMIIATDSDDAGWDAAQKDTTILATLPINLRRLAYTDVKDPGEAYQTHPDLLAMQLAHPDILPSMAAATLQRDISRTLSAHDGDPGRAFDHPVTLLNIAHTAAAETATLPADVVDQEIDVLSQILHDTDQARSDAPTGTRTGMPASTIHQWKTILERDVGDIRLDYAQPHEPAQPALPPIPDADRTLSQISRDYLDLDSPDYDWPDLPPDSPYQGIGI